MKKTINRLTRISLFDGLLIAFTIVGIAIFAYVFLRKASYITVTVKIGSDHILWDGGSTKAWFNYYFREGMKQRDGFGSTTAEVVKLRSYDYNESRKAVYATVKLKTVYNRSSNTYTFQGKPVLIGSTIKMYLDRLLVEGLITYIEGAQETRDKKTLIVETQLKEETTVFPETSGGRAYVADAIEEGQEVKDDQGNTIVKVLKKIVEDAKKTVITSDGRVLVQHDPLRKDVYLTLQLDAVRINDRYYVFDDVPVLIGYPVPINTGTMSFWPEIIKFLPSQ